MRTITGLEELKQAEGEDLGTSDWHEVTQKAIDAFADVTGDHQWIHVDVERAKQTPFGGTIAHGYYTLSLAPMLTEQVFALEGFAFAINYGLEQGPLPGAAAGRQAGAAARRSCTELADVPGGAQMTVEVDVRGRGRRRSPSASPRRSPASTRLAVSGPGPRARCRPCGARGRGPVR